MFAQRLHVLLIGTILACPVLCNVGICDCHKDSGKTDVACCSNCDSSPTSDLPRTPSNELPNQPCKKQCQCFCGGGILSDTIDFMLRPEIADAIGVLEINLSDGDFETCRSDVFVRDNTRFRTGRQVRCLHMSLLC